MKENNDFVVRTIKKVAKLRGECTGFDYSVNSEYQDITIRDERYTLFVKRDNLEGFIRELTEILDEIKRI